jgi:hypothetical protein
MPGGMRAGLPRGVGILRGPGGGRPWGLPEPHVAANYSLMIAELAVVVVVQDPQLLLRARGDLGDILNRSGDEGARLRRLLNRPRSGAATKPQKDVGKDEPCCAGAQDRRGVWPPVVGNRFSANRPRPSSLVLVLVLVTGSACARSRSEKRRR